MNIAHRRRLWRCMMSFMLIAFIATALYSFTHLIEAWVADLSPFNQKKIAEVIGGKILKNNFPENLSSKDFRNQNTTFANWPMGPDASQDLQVHYTIDWDLQQNLQKLVQSYRPDWASFVAIDVHTGKVLTLYSYSLKSEDESDNLALQASFPAASVFKIVTAAAAVESRNFSAETIIPFNGSNHTLYRSNVQHEKSNRWTRFWPLKVAFGRSINTVFGKLGMHHLGRDVLLDYAHRFGFNQHIETDFPIEPSQVNLEMDDQWGLAEAASGFTQNNTLSPLHAALLAAAIVNDGQMVRPHIVDSITNLQGATLYRSTQPSFENVITPKSAEEIRTMMEETVRSGTSRSIFSTFRRSKKYHDIQVGGKTGSLTGTNPKGKCDWFVGYAQRGDSKIAFAALTIHEEYWRVRSTYVARRFIENYFDRLPENPKPTKPQKVAADL